MTTRDSVSFIMCVHTVYMEGLNVEGKEESWSGHCPARLGSQRFSLHLGYDGGDQCLVAMRRADHPANERFVAAKDSQPPHRVSGQADGDWREKCTQSWPSSHVW